MTTTRRNSGRRVDPAQPAGRRGRAGVAVSTLIILGACASGPSADEQTPTWVDSRSHAQYPEELYLVGIGTATDSNRDAAYQQARDRAIADIAGQLETHIRSEVTTYVQESIRMEGGRTESSLLSDASSSVKAVTEGTLKSIQPVAQHYDPQSALGAALVVIKRSDFARQAVQELEDIDGKVSTLFGEAQTLAAEGKSFQAVRRYTAVEPILVRRTAVAAQANFVLPRSATAEPAATLAEVFAARREAAGKVQLTLLCRHQEFGQSGPIAQLEQMFVGEFAELGLVVKAGPETLTADAIATRWNDTVFLREVFGGTTGQPLVLLCEVSTTSQPVGHEDMIGVRSSGSARLLDANSGELLITATYSPDAAGHTPAIGRPSRRGTLVEKALAQLAEHLASRVLERI